MRTVCLLHANAFNELFRAIDDGDEVCCALRCAVLFSHHLIIIISSLRVLRGVCWSRIFLLENLPYDRFCTLLLSFWSSLHISLHIYYFTYHFRGCSSRQNFLMLSKIKNVFLFVFSRKKVFVLTFYSLREKCPREERQQQQYLE